jgi:hypothetical protein
MIFWPSRAMAAHGLSVSGFCSSPRTSRPSNNEVNLPQPTFGGSDNRVLLGAKHNHFGIIRESLPPYFNQRFFERHPAYFPSTESSGASVPFDFPPNTKS